VSNTYHGKKVSVKDISISVQGYCGSCFEMSESQTTIIYYLLIVRQNITNYLLKLFLQDVSHVYHGL